MANRGGGGGGAGGPSSRSRPVTKFFGCYLVGSQNPAMKGRSYVGFTVNPPRRIQQHNGVLAAGARYTRRLRPCQMIVVVHGFPSKVQALQFEWAWQKPRLSRAVREVAVKLGLSDRSSSLPNKIKLMMAMLHLSPWQHLPLTLHFLSSEHAQLARRIGPAPPEQIELVIGTMDELKQVVGSTFGNNNNNEEEEEEEDDEDSDGGDDSDGGGGGEEDEEESLVSVSHLGGGGGGAGGSPSGSEVTQRRQGHEHRRRCCAVCGEAFKRVTAVAGDDHGITGIRGGGGGGGDGGTGGGDGADGAAATTMTRRRGHVGCPGCGIMTHPSCMASHFFSLAATAAASLGRSPPPPRALIPSRGRCPSCDKPLSWGSVIAAGCRSRRRRQRPVVDDDENHATANAMATEGDGGGGGVGTSTPAREPFGDITASSPEHKSSAGARRQTAAAAAAKTVRERERARVLEWEREREKEREAERARVASWADGTCSQDFELFDDDDDDCEELASDDDDDDNNLVYREVSEKNIVVGLDVEGGGTRINNVNLSPVVEEEEELDRDGREKEERAEEEVEEEEEEVMPLAERLLKRRRQSGPITLSISP